MTSVLVTGATGFLGGRLCINLIELGYDVKATGRSKVACEKLHGLGIETVQADLSELDECRNLLKFGAVDVVVHCAALSAPFGSKQDFVCANVIATKNLLELCKPMQVKRIVYISSPSIYFDYKDQLNVSEDMPLPKPVNAYAETKCIAEQLIKKTRNFKTIILRPRGIYGFGDTALLPRLMKVASTNSLPIFRNGNAKIDLTHVNDVIAAITAAINYSSEKSGEAFNISGGQVLPVRKIVDMVCGAANLNPKWKKIPLPLALLYAALIEKIYGVLPNRPEPPITQYSLGLFAYEQSLDISKAERVLNWTPRISFEEGLRETFQIGCVK